MKKLLEKIEEWDFNLLQKKYPTRGQISLSYNSIFKNIEILTELKYEPYQPTAFSSKHKFLHRLKVWLDYFNEKYQKYLFYLSSKIIFFTHDQIMYLIKNVSSKFEKLMLEDIIEAKKLDSFSYLEAKKFLKEKSKKNLYVSLTDSSRINDFCHLNNIDRDRNVGIELETLLYPAKRKKEVSQNDKLICKDFEMKILITDPVIQGKEKLIIIDDFSGSGTDILETILLLEDSQIPIKDIIFISYIKSHKAKEIIDNFLLNFSSQLTRKYRFIFGEFIPESAKCFNNSESYLLREWINDGDICQMIKLANHEIFLNIFSKLKEIPPEFGVGNLCSAIVLYFNCPDNTLPIIWKSCDHFKPLFLRSKRVL